MGKLFSFYQRKNWSLDGVTGSKSHSQSVKSCVYTASPLVKPEVVPPPCALPLLWIHRMG